jgi:hypothetical protein
LGCEKEDLSLAKIVPPLFQFYRQTNFFAKMELLVILKNLIVVAEDEMKNYLNETVHLAIKSMEDKNDWMLRKEAVDLIFTILKILGSDSISTTKYENRVFSSLQTLKFDKIQNVREATKKTLSILPQQNEVENVVIKKIRTPIKETLMNPSFGSPSTNKENEVKIVVVENKKEKKENKKKKSSSSSSEESEDTESSKEATSNDEYQNFSNESQNSFNDENKSFEKSKKPLRNSANRRNNDKQINSSSELEKLPPNKKFNLSLRLENIKKSFKDPQSPRNQSQNLLHQINQNLNPSFHQETNTSNNSLLNNQFKQNYPKSNQYQNSSQNTQNNLVNPYQNNFQNYQQEKIYASPNPIHHNTSFPPNIYSQPTASPRNPFNPNYPQNQNTINYPIQPQNLIHQFSSEDPNLINSNLQRNQHEELKSIIFKVLETQQFIVNKIDEMQSTFDRNLNTLNMRIRMLEQSIQERKN